MTEDVRITDAELSRLRVRIGSVVTIKDPPYLTEVTRDAIRHWTAATGDRNPLYTDPAYAQASCHQAVVAPPTMLYAFSRLSIGYRGGLPGVHSMFAGSHWRWKQPIRLGDTITAEVTFQDLVELPSRFARRMFKQISHIDFRSSDSQLVAEAECWGMRTERQTAKATKKYDYLEPQRYTSAELEKIAATYKNEYIRGAAPLYWEDVSVGMSIPEIIRGPYTATTAIAFEQGWGGLFIHAHGYWFDFLSRHPGGQILNEYGIPEPPEAVHWDSTLASSVGVPRAYDYGPERISWLATMLTNWIGDRGALKELYCEIRRFNMVGDLTYGRARVTKLDPCDDSTGEVKLEVTAADQRGEPTVSGWAVVSLPRRASRPA